MLAALPQDRLTPETTAEREGFIHVHTVEATAGRARRSARSCATSTTTQLDEHVALLRRTAEEVVASEPRARLEFKTEQPVPEHAHATSTRTRRSSEAALEAIRREGFEPRRVPARGGTDGSILSARGLPTPNLFTGGHEYHSMREWASVQDMASAAAVAVRLVGVWAERAACAAWQRLAA